MTRIGTSYLDRSTLVGNYETKKSFFLGQLTNKQDNYNFSAVGMRLNIIYNGQRIERATATPIRNWDTVLDGSKGNAELRRADRHISQAGKLLEKMVEIAEAAQDPNLSDYDRILMQMELGGLQHELDCSNKRMGGMGDNRTKGRGHLLNTNLNYTDTNSYKMLERARDRIARGEKWDVAEVRNTILEDKAPAYMDIPGELNYDEVKALYNTEDGWVGYLKQQKPEWDNANVYFEKAEVAPNSLGVFSSMLSDDEDPSLNALGYVWETTDDSTVPTVGEILKGDGRSIMDAEAAVITAEELKKELAGLDKQREQLKTLATESAAVKDMPSSSDEKSAIVNKIMHYMVKTLPSFFNTLYRESFQFTFGEKCNVFGKTRGERDAEMAQNNGVVFHDLKNTSVEFDVPKIHADDIQIPDTLNPK